MEDIKKTCIICFLEKQLDEFYKHKQMTDGHLNKCKECCKKQSKEREEKLRKDPEWVEKEKERGREKYNRLGYKEKHKPDFYSKKRSIENYKNKYPEKIKCRNLTSSMKAIIKGNQLHHWSYNIEHAKDVIELSVEHHKKAHRFIVYDQEQMMYRRYDTNELLDTKERHLDFIAMCIKNKI